MSPSGSGVNALRQALETRLDPMCQTEVDAKAFKGKGALGLLRHHVDMQEGVELRMSQLSAASKTAGQVDLYLMLHRRARTGYVFLRWREVGGAKRHLGWDAVEERAAGRDGTTRRWLVQMSAQAQQLNDEHLRARETVGRIRRELMVRAQPVFPRSISDPPADI